MHLHHSHYFHSYFFLFSRLVFAVGVGCRCVGCGLRPVQNQGFHIPCEHLVTGGKRCLLISELGSLHGKWKRITLVITTAETREEDQATLPLFTQVCTHTRIYQPEQPQKGRLQMQPPSPSHHLLLRHLWNCHFQCCHPGPAWWRLLPPWGSGQGRDLSSTRHLLKDLKRQHVVLHQWGG